MAKQGQEMTKDKGGVDEVESCGGGQVPEGPWQYSTCSRPKATWMGTGQGQGESCVNRIVKALCAGCATQGQGVKGEEEGSQGHCHWGTLTQRGSGVRRALGWREGHHERTDQGRAQPG